MATVGNYFHTRAPDGLRGAIAGVGESFLETPDAIRHRLPEAVCGQFEAPSNRPAAARTAAAAFPSGNF